jgi:cytochrome c556
MNHLVSAIMLLEYPEIVEGAEQIAADASLSRPITGDATELNAALPQGFFLHQDQLRAQARALADAAGALDAYRVADAYGRLSEACVRCHAVYRQGDAQAARPR